MAWPSAATSAGVADRRWDEEHAEDLEVMRERLLEEAEWVQGEAVWRLLDRDVRYREWVISIRFALDTERLFDRHGWGIVQADD